ncbi:Ig-like domain-containing protein [Clostridium sp. ZBS12]|uniref:Ig-like domain-containing protein n=1 Tax=Clostridium sp. ZBS12 TaxID=2949972 RepID=UPI002079F26C|nr:Ig-like domain-containing protein [Clostridium sp. ZBS12]
MKSYFKKFSIMFVMTFAIILGCCTSVFAADDFEIGTTNLNRTTENSAKVEDQLFHPEIGWKRYDDTDVNIEYSYAFKIIEYPHFYKEAMHYLITGHKEKNTIKFSFYGSKLRLIDSMSSNRMKTSKISFDGGRTFEKCSAYADHPDANYQSIFYEKTNLDKKVHNVIIEMEYDDGAFGLEALDIDNDGYLQPYIEQKESILLNNSTLILPIDTSKQLTATTPSAVDIDWSSSDETVATIDSNGNVKAIKEGQVTITAQIKGTDIKTNCIVTVTKKDTVPEPTDPEQEYIINTAYAKGDNTNNASGQVSIIFKGVAEAQLKVVKTADVDSVYVGDNFTYTIEVTNTSDKTAKSVVINDSAPNHIQFIPSGVTTTQGTVDSSSTAKNIIVNVGDIPPLGKVIIKIPVLVVE